MTYEEIFSNPIILVVLAVLAYLFSQIIEFILDRYVKRFRIDKWLLYFLMVKSPYAKTKITLTTLSRPDIKKIKEKIESQFHEGLDNNEKPKGNSYSFKIRGHPTPFKISLVEPDVEGNFTVILETIGEDFISKTGRSSLNNTIRFFEKICRNLNELILKNIVVKIRISYRLENKSNIIYNYENNKQLTTNTITVNSNQFSDITDMVKDCLKEWRMTFL